ncbi:MAG TPA: pseudouridine synthase, partial [Actinomycetota bacterium]
VVLGLETSTLDASGEPTARWEMRSVTEEEFREEAAAFVGDIEQIPPMVSAVKVGGERLYEKARRGEEVEREPRRVVVYAFDLLELTPGAEPHARFDVICSAGTYVRTLVHDLGESLGCGAHLVSLRRTEAAGFSEADAVPLETVTADALRPPLDAVKWLPGVQVDEGGAEMVSHGRPLELDRIEGEGGPTEGMLLSIVHAGTLLAVYRCEGDALVPHRVFT